MTWNDQFDKIQPGDVFVKRWGVRDLVHVMLPMNSRSAKQPYMNLASGTTDSTYNHKRSSYGSRSGKNRWRHVGTIPADRLVELTEKGTLR